MARTIRPSDVIHIAPDDFAPAHLRLSPDVLARRAARAARQAEDRAKRRRDRENRRREKRKGP